MQMQEQMQFRMQQENGKKQPIHKMQKQIINSSLNLKKPSVQKLPVIEEYEPLSDVIDSDQQYQKQDESDLKLKELELREFQLNNKNIQLEKMISNYNYLFNTEYLHIEVYHPDNIASYKFPLNNITNITHIKLNHYSIPDIQLNVEENKNNFIIIKRNDIETKISINKGKYTIDSLINVLNEKLENIKLSLTLEQHIKIETTNDTPFDLIETELTQNNLGFITKNTGKTEYISDNIWDLRIDNKVYLYITNLSDTPFGVLFANGSSCSEFKFREPIDLDTLDISFRDSKGLPYNFYKLPHTLSFLVSKKKN